MLITVLWIISSKSPDGLKCCAHVIHGCMDWRRFLAAVACAAAGWGCSCSTIGIVGQADTSIEMGDDDSDGGVIAVCGNGVVDEGEECDDGDSDDCNGCNDDCRWMRALHVEYDVPGAYVEPEEYPCLSCPYTVETWFRLDGEDSAVTFFEMLQFASMVSGTTEYTDLVFFRDLWGGGSMDPGSPDIGISLEPGVWHHHAEVCWVRSGDRHTAVFFDGVQWGAGVIDRDSPNTPACIEGMRILDEQHEVAPYHFRAATIDDLRISDAGLYTSSFTPERHLAVRPDTVAMWNFDQESDGIIPDVSGTGHDAELVGGVLVPDECHLP